MWWLALIGCVDSDLGKTLVFALDETPEPVLDRQTCGTGVGLAIPLGIERSLAIDIAIDGVDALLGTCVLDDGGGVISCGTLLPEVRLVLEDDGTIVGTTAVPVGIEGTSCAASLDNTWTMTIADDRLEGSLQAIWRLADTNVCEDFEGDVIDSSGNGRGIHGCVLDYAYGGTLIAKCEVTGTGFACVDP